MGDSRSMNSYMQLINKHEGISCFIFGAGPSLWFNMREPFFNDIHKYGITITVNSSVMAVPNFDYWLSNDALCRRWSWWKTVKMGTGTKIVRDSWKKYKKELKKFLFFSHRPTSEGIINSGDIGLSYCSSIPSSIDLAIQMGCKKIFVLGLDHNEYEGKHHFWQFMPPKQRPRSTPPAQGPWKQQKSVFSLNVKALKALKGFAELRDAKIYNVNCKCRGKYITKVDVFPKIEINDMGKILGL